MKNYNYDYAKKVRKLIILLLNDDVYFTCSDIRKINELIDSLIIKLEKGEIFD